MRFMSLRLAAVQLLARCLHIPIKPRDAYYGAQLGVITCASAATADTLHQSRSTPNVGARTA